MSDPTLADAINRSQHHGLIARITSQQIFWVFMAAVFACLALTILTDLSLIHI